MNDFFYFFLSNGDDDRWMKAPIDMSMIGQKAELLFKTTKHSWMQLRQQEKFKSIESCNSCSCNYSIVSTKISWQVGGNANNWYGIKNREDS